MVSGDEAWTSGGRPAGWKRSASDTRLDSIANLNSKRRRDDERPDSSRSEEDVGSLVGDAIPQMMPVEVDRRDLLQMALDQICELQRKIRDDSSEGDTDAEIEDGDDTVSVSEAEAEAGADPGATPSDRDVVLAGFDFCTKEALKFLVEEEGLGPQHPAVRALTEHLRARKRSLNCGQLLAGYL